METGAFELEGMTVNSSLNCVKTLSGSNLSHHFTRVCLITMYPSGSMLYCHFRIQGILYLAMNWRVGENRFS